MNISLRHHLLAVATALCGATASFATVVDFSYAPSDNLRGLGSGTAETYDVAIRLDGSEFGGARLLSLSVPLKQSEYITSPKAWLASALTIDKRVNVADLFSADATVEDDVLDFSFPEPVIIPAEGLYVGYSFTVSKVNDDDTADPVATCSGTHENGLYVHSTYFFSEWKSMSEMRDMVSALSVKIDGDFPAADIALYLGEEEINVSTSTSELTIPLKIVNAGASAVSELEFSVNIGNNEATTVKCPPPSASLRYGHSYDIEVTVENTCKKGTQPLSVSLTKIDGTANSSTQSSIDTEVFAYKYMPKKRALLEEYTALWCNYCPSGFAAFEYMNREYGDDFIGVAFHSDDKMAVSEPEAFPQPVYSYPSAYLDRGELLDPYYGSGTGGTIEDDWLRQQATFTPVEIYMIAARDAHTPYLAEVNCDLSFIKEYNDNLSVFFYLTADGLSDPSWKQNNSYAGYDPADFVIPDMAQFCEGERKMSGLVFNDIVIMHTPTTGIPDCLPEKIVADQLYNIEYDFDIRECSSLDGENLAIKATGLHVVAGVVDCTTGRILNAAKTHVDYIGGVESALGNGSVVETRYYDISGRKIDSPGAGITIIRSLYSDGSATSSKIIR